LNEKLNSFVSVYEARLEQEESVLRLREEEIQKQLEAFQAEQQEERWAMLAVAVDVCEGIYLDESKERERLCEVKRSEYARTVALCRRHAYESEPHEVREFLDQQTEEHRNEVLDDLVYLKVLKAKLSRSERRDVERE
jgi:hypothetical protein